jgi:archaellum component FlaC
MNQDNITLEQTIDKVKELNKEVKGLKELLDSMMTHIKHTYGYIQDIANVLNAADKEWIPREDK